MLQNVTLIDCIILQNKATSQPKTPKNRRTKIKYYEVFPERHNPVAGERAIWVAVITQALMDALSKSGSREAIYYKHEAVHWLTGNSQNFNMVCFLAGFEPDYIRRMAKRALVSPKAWRMAPGKGKRYLERRAYRQRQKKGGR